MKNVHEPSLLPWDSQRCHQVELAQQIRPENETHLCKPKCSKLQNKAVDHMEKATQAKGTANFAAESPLSHTFTHIEAVLDHQYLHIDNSPSNKVHWKAKFLLFYQEAACTAHYSCAPCQNSKPMKGQTKEFPGLFSVTAGNRVPHANGRAFNMHIFIILCIIVLRSRQPPLLY